jgi:hypothetical protein
MVIAVPGYNYLWMGSVDPDSAVENGSGFFATKGATYINLTTGAFFMCKSDTPSQVWELITYYSQLLQADWAQTNSSSLDFIKNKPALSFTTPTFASATTSTRLSTTRSVQVLYSFPTSMTSLLVSQSLTATLQYADDAGFTTNVVNVNVDVQGCSGILSLTLLGRLQVQGIIPANKYRRVVLAQTGGATVPTTLSSGQEVLL